MKMGGTARPRGRAKGGRAHGRRDREAAAAMAQAKVASNMLDRDLDRAYRHDPPAVDDHHALA